MIKLDWLWNEVKWGLNGLIRCCLLIGDSTRLNHSDVIPPHSSSFRSQSMWEALIKMEWCWKDWMMLEWRASQNPVFFSPSKNNLIPLSFRHSDIIPSFLKCKGMKITMEGISFKSHSSHLHFIPISPVIRGMTEWGGMKGDSWSKAKPLILKISSFHCHSVIPCNYCILHMVIPFIWRPFLPFEGHSLSNCHSSWRSI